MTCGDGFHEHGQIKNKPTSSFLKIKNFENNSANKITDAKRTSNSRRVPSKDLIDQKYLKSTKNLSITSSLVKRMTDKLSELEHTFNLKKMYSKDWLYRTNRDLTNNLSLTSPLLKMITNQKARHKSSKLAHFGDALSWNETYLKDVFDHKNRYVTNNLSLTSPLTERVTHHLGNSTSNRVTNVEHTLDRKQMYSGDLFDYTNQDITNNLSITSPLIERMTYQLDLKNSNELTEMEDILNERQMYSKYLFKYANRLIINNLSLTSPLMEKRTNQLDDNTLNNRTNVKHNLHRKAMFFKNLFGSVNEYSKYFFTPSTINASEKNFDNSTDKLMKLFYPNKHTKYDNTSRNLNQKDKGEAKKVPGAESTLNFYINNVRKNIKYRPMAQVNNREIETEVYQKVKNSEDERINDLKSGQYNKGMRKYLIKNSFAEAILKKYLKGMLNKTYTQNEIHKSQHNETRCESNLLFIMSLAIKVRTINI